MKLSQEEKDFLAEQIENAIDKKMQTIGLHVYLKHEGLGTKHTTTPVFKIIHRTIDGCIQEEATSLWELKDIMSKYSLPKEEEDPDYWEDIGEDEEDPYDL